LMALLREISPTMAPGEARDQLLSASVAPATDRTPEPGARTDVCAVIAHAARACPCICDGNAQAEVSARPW